MDDKKDRKPRKPPQIVRIGMRDVLSTQRFNVPMVADKLITDAVNDWCSIIDIARFVYGKALKEDRCRVRKYIWHLRKELIKRGYLLLTEGRPVDVVKIHVGSPLEDQYAATLLKKMKSRTDISADVYAKAELIFNQTRGTPLEAAG